MSLEHDIETINEYMQWKAVRQDTSPEAFVKDRAQQTAYERLSQGIEYMEACRDDLGDWQISENDFTILFHLLNGTR